MAQDFGISQVADLTMAATTTAAAGGGGKGGTPVYMAPEQHDDEEFGQPGAKADIWALGCVLL